jgi:hypothetical protein
MKIVIIGGTGPIGSNMDDVCLTLPTQPSTSWAAWWQLVP